MPNIGPVRNSASTAKSMRRRKIKLAFDKVIRDSFTMPAVDYELIGALKQRCIGLGIAMKKSELLRAGLAALRQLPDEGLAQIVTAVESVKTGRPPRKTKRTPSNKKAKNRKKKRTHKPNHVRS